ncbi:hypothetical protein HAX54_019629, partial [Datura stramonium]|nr:hypothetical protein [Datura stramonium]
KNVLEAKGLWVVSLEVEQKKSSSLDTDLAQEFVDASTERESKLDEEIQALKTELISKNKELVVL